MYLIVTEPLTTSDLAQLNTKELDRDNIEWFAMPVLRFDRHGKQVIKKVIVRKITYDDFIKNFKIADIKVKRKYIADSMIVTNYVKGGFSGHLNA